MPPEMTPEEHRAVEAHFHAARELGDEARRAYLDEHCAGDVRTFVESLLARDRERSLLLPEAPERVGPYRVLRPWARAGWGSSTSPRTGP